MVASNPKAYALERAKNAGVETEVLVRKEFSTQDAYDDALLGLLERHNIDLVVLAGFMTILSERVAKAYAYRMINVHPALIPSFCGQGYYYWGNGSFRQRGGRRRCDHFAESRGGAKRRHA